MDLKGPISKGREGKEEKGKGKGEGEEGMGKEEKVCSRNFRLF